MEQTTNVKGANALNDPKEREKFKNCMVALSEYFQIIEDQKETIKEVVNELSETYELDKKIVRKMAVTMFKSNYADQRKESDRFSELYERVIIGRLLED